MTSPISVSLSWNSAFIGWTSTFMMIRSMKPQVLIAASTASAQAGERLSRLRSGRECPDSPEEGNDAVADALDGHSTLLWRGAC